MALPARAAAVRGDDYQYAVAWHAACRALTEPGVESVSAEDAGAGSFDDVVLRKLDGRHEFIQVKNSNYGNVVITSEWLLTAAKGGKAPLRHLYETWRRLRGEGVTFKLIASRAIDERDPVLSLRDVNSGLLMPKIGSAGPRSEAGKARVEWAEALDVDEGELLDFLSDVQFLTEGNEESWRQRTKPLMRQAGLRADDAAVTLGIHLVREWVKRGAGPRTPGDIRREAAGAQLLAQDETLVLAVHAIDRPGSARVATLTLDWVDRFDGETARSRRVLQDPDGWSELAGELTSAEVTLASFGVPRLHIDSAMRLSAGFAVGAAFPQTRRWTLTLDQHGSSWTTSHAAGRVEDSARLLVPVESLAVDAPGEVAVVVSLTHDATEDVRAYVVESQLASTLVAIGPSGEIGRDSVRDGEHASTWARSARELLRAELRRVSPTARRLHLFLSGPLGAGVFLGHDWNLLPETVVYEHVGGASYAATFTID